ncbi:MAG: hypothetical protein PHC34_09755 [Candidatus Gastranaerophilales bacterium]|nr:hypothetical protein [Candidatus Gastranaerophilales bacterium]
MEEIKITKTCDACKKTVNDLYPITIPKEVIPEKNKKFTPELYRDEKLNICSDCMIKVAHTLEVR